MKRARDFSLMFDRLIVGILALVIIGVLGVLAVSVARRSDVDEEFQQSLEELQDTSVDLQDTMEQLRSSSEIRYFSTQMRSMRSWTASAISLRCWSRRSMNRF